MQHLLYVSSKPLPTAKGPKVKGKREENKGIGAILSKCLLGSHSPLEALWVPSTCHKTDLENYPPTKWTSSESEI